MNSFLQGAIGMAFLIAGMFFLRYWKGTRDRLFLFFALAFGILGLNRGLFVAFGHSQQEPYQLYLIRLIAFLIIIAAIVDKICTALLRSSSTRLITRQSHPA